MERFLEAGKIVNTHGINGELKIQPWCDSVEFLLDLPEVYIDGVKKEVVSARKHKQFALFKLDGVESIDAALELKNKIICIDRNSVELDEDSYFISDVLGFSVFDRRKNAVIGTLADFIEAPASDIYVVKGKTGEILIPAVPEFIKNVDYENRTLEVMTIEGMD